MSLVELSGAGVLWMPPLQASTVATPGLRSGALLDAVGEQHALVYEVSSKSDGKTIDRLGVRLAVVAASDNVDARLENVDPTNGEPDGTLATINSNKSQTVSATGWNEFVLTATHGPVSAGDLLAVVIEIPSGSTASVTTGEHRRINMGGTAFPYVLKSAGSGYVKSGLSGSAGQRPSLSVGFSDGSWESLSGSLPIVTLPTASLTSTGTPSEAGLEFEVPFLTTLSRIQWLLFPAAATLDLHVGNGSYNPGDTGGTRLATRSVDPDILYANTSGLSREFVIGDVDLAINTTYRVTVEATSATAVLVAGLTVDDAAVLSAFPGGTSWKWIEDNGAGGWTTTSTRIPLCNLGFSRFDNGAGGGGGGVGKIAGIGGGLAG